jgi:DNA invertase Pin-like site-specific DNA recombinase
MTDTLRPTKLQAWHLERSAIVYVRQSTPQQVLEHQESTARQYALVDRAVALGWPRQQILIIDDDLGKSGQSIEGRLGFQRLLAEVALDHVGLILGLEMSRLARSCKDWHQLLELCARFRTLLADADGLYDPTDFNDRLLLGLKGTMSEAELHVLKARLYQGKLNKARRGELFTLPPIGYIKLPTGEFTLDPDAQVQTVVRLVFDQFDRQGTVHGLLRYLVRHGIQMPVRGRSGVHLGQLQWSRPNRPTLQNLLHHPIYAGAYCYGRWQIDPRRRQPGRRGTGKQGHRAEDCLVLLRDRLPAYITWERFEANQQRLADNRARHDALGAPRQGAALLGGLLFCGRCGRRMQIHYPRANSGLAYGCSRAEVEYAEPRCQHLSSGAVLDGWIAEQVLAAVQPVALEASLAAAADIERERGDLLRHWQQRRERARYESERAARQYHACEPENRLVARALERQWEEVLQQQRQLEEEFERWQRTAPVELSAADRAVIHALAADLPAVWQAATTTPADRQRIIRLLLERVELTVDKTSERLEVKVTWVGGHEQRQVLVRPVSSYQRHSDYPRLAARLRELSAQHLPAWRIAEQLNAEGFHHPKLKKQLSHKMVYRLQVQLGLPRRAPMGSRVGLQADEWRVSELARRLGVRRDTVERWQRVQWLHAYRDADGYWTLWADADEIARLQALHALPRTQANKERLAKLRKPKPMPKRYAANATKRTRLNGA